MPTTRKRRSRNLRHSSGSLVEQYIHGEIDIDALCEAHGSPFVQFVITSKHNAHVGAEAYEIWCRDGQALLAKHGYQGQRRHPKYNIVDYGDLPENLVRMVSGFGEPWK